MAARLAVRASWTDELRKSFEVALHAGAGAALAIDLRRELVGELAGLDAQRLVVIALSLVPPALAGYVLRAPDRAAPGRPALDRRGPRCRRGRDGARRPTPRAQTRTSQHARRGTRARRDGLALGLAQAVALIPGVSRSGATLTAARARGFSRGAAQTLSWHAGCP